MFYLKAQSSANVAFFALTFLRPTGFQYAFFENSTPFIAPLFPNDTLTFSDFPNSTPTATAVFGNGGIQVPPGQSFAACLQTWVSQITSLNCLANLGNGGTVGSGWVALASSGSCCTTNQTLTVGANSNGLAPGQYNALLIATDTAMTQVLGYLVVQLNVAYTSVFPHLVSGPLGSDVWTTSLILVNQTSRLAFYSIAFFGDNGQPLKVTVNNANLSSGAGSIPAKSQITLQVSSGAYVSGWAGLSGAGVTGQAVFHRHVATVNQDYEGTVPLSSGGVEYLVPFDSTSFNGTLPYITGLAVVNLDGLNTAFFQCTVYDTNGNNLGLTSLMPIQPQNHGAFALTSASGYSAVTGKQGTLDCTTGGPQIAVLGLRFLGTNGMTSFSPVKLQ